MDNNKRDIALQMSTQLHLCLVTAIDTALKDRMGEDWYSTFSQYDKSQPKPIINQSQSSVTRWDLQACLKFLRYRSDYAKIVFEYYGHNFFVNNDDARKAQLLLNQLLDNLIHNARNQIFAHA